MSEILKEFNADMTALGDSVRAKTGATGPLSVKRMKLLVDGIATGGITTAASGAAITLTNAMDAAYRGMVLYGKSTQDGTPSPDAPADIVSVGDDGDAAVYSMGRNICPNFLESGEKNGVSYAVNADGTITVNGTATADLGISMYNSADGMYLIDKVTLSGLTGGSSAYYMQPYFDGKASSAFYDGEKAYSAKGKRLTRVAIFIKKDAVFENLVLSPMLNYGETALPYEPYSGQWMTISVPGGLCGIPVEDGGNHTDANGQQWVCDEVDFVRGVKIQRTYTKVFDGTESIINGTGLELAYALADGGHPEGISDTEMKNSMSTHFETYTRQDLYDAGNEAGFIGCSAAQGFIRFVENVNANGDTTVFKSYLAGQYAAGTPVTVTYILAEPVETALTEEELAAYAALRTKAEYTAVYNDGGAEMTLEYAAKSTEAGDTPVLQEKTVTPKEYSQEVVPDYEYDGMSKVTIMAIPENYVIPEGTTTLTENGTHDVSEYKSAVVDVPVGITPTGIMPITKNGNYVVTQYAEVEVNVPTGGGVSAGELNRATGTATANPIDTGLSTIQYFMMHRLGTNTGLVSLIYDATTQTVYYVFCSSSSEYIQKFTAASMAYEVTGGVFEWTSTLTNSEMNGSYTWIALGSA